MCCVVTHAYAGRWYSGVQLGYAKLNQTTYTSGQVMPDTITLISKTPTFSVSGSPWTGLASQTVNTFVTKDSNGAWYVNVFGGYAFNRFAALELGFFATDTYDNSYSATTTSTFTTLAGTPTIPFNMQRTDRNRLFIFDLAYKASLPLNPYFDLFAKFGYALYFEYTTSHLKGIIPGDGIAKIKLEKTRRRTAPLIAVGASYSYSPSMSIDFTWTRIIPHLGQRSSSDYIDLLGVGVTYGICTSEC